MIVTFVLSVLMATSTPANVTSPLPSAIAQINDERQASGALAVSSDGCLSSLAARRAADMVARDYFGHRTPDGRLPWDSMRANGCSFRYAAENIAEASNTMQAVSELWNSPEHRKNTLDPRFHKIGVGVATRLDGTQVFVEDFTD